MFLTDLIPSGGFIARAGLPIINIHHSFLPAFIGAGPYTRAQDRVIRNGTATIVFA